MWVETTRKVCLAYSRYENAGRKNVRLGGELLDEVKILGLSFGVE